MEASTKLTSSTCTSTSSCYPTKTPRISQRIQLEGEPTICSLQELQVQIAHDIREHLAMPYRYANANGYAYAYARVDRILQAMKTPPSTTVCRVNLILGTRQQIQALLQQELQRLNLDELFQVQADPLFHDVLHVQYKHEHKHEHKSSNHLRGPPHDPHAPPVFPTWPERQGLGWPLQHRAVIVDRICGEAVLRGSHIFVKGIMCADKGILPGETIAIYADVRTTISKNRRLKRGAFLEQYRNRLCVYLGLGIAMVQRSDFFKFDKGIGIQIMLTREARVGPMLPPISGILPSQLYFQNLPSIMVAHALESQPGQVIIDMCAAPGGKTSHVASLVHNNATIIACDKSRKKMSSAQNMFQEMGAACITALALDTTACVINDSNTRTAQQVGRRSRTTGVSIVYHASQII
jgi:methyltransferase NSUN6